MACKYSVINGLNCTSIVKNQDVAKRAHTIFGHVYTIFAHVYTIFAHVYTIWSCLYDMVMFIQYLLMFIQYGHVWALILMTSSFLFQPCSPARSVYPVGWESYWWVLVAFAIFIFVITFILIIMVVFLYNS